MLEFILFFIKEIFFKAKDSDITNKNFNIVKFLSMRALVASILFNFYLINKVVHIAFKETKCNKSVIEEERNIKLLESKGNNKLPEDTQSKK